MRKVLQGSIRAGEQVTRTAERLLDVDLPTVELPSYVQELREAAKFPRGPGDRNLYEEAVTKFRGQVSRLGQGAELAEGEFTIRSASRQLVRDLRQAKPAQVDRIVDRWVLERARFQARVIARHESVESFREVSLRSVREQPWVKGVRWTLSPSHPRPDICDMHANVDQYGLGPGGYPVDAVPRRHPLCLCSLVPISDHDHFKREIAKARGTPEPPEAWKTDKRESAEDWLRAQPKDFRQAVAGPTRAKLAADGHRVYERGESGYRPVHRLLDQPKPRIRRGPRVDASRIVARDRASMARPFPRISQ